MTKIYKMGEDHYAIRSEDVDFEGDRLTVMVYATEFLGFDPDEIELGMLALIEKEDHDTLDYGVYKRFIFSSKRERMAA